MDPCQSLRFYLFENGVPCNPQVLNIKRKEIPDTFKKSKKNYTYQGKTLYTTDGEAVAGFDCAGEENLYVLVECPPFKCADYKI